MMLVSHRGIFLPSGDPMYVGAPSLGRGNDTTPSLYDVFC